MNRPAYNGLLEITQLDSNQTTQFGDTCKDAYECESTFSSSISNSPAVTTSNIAGWIATVTGTSSKTITFKTSLFSAAPICQVTPNGTSNIEHAISSVTSSTVVVNSYSSSGSPANEGFNISCTRSTDHVAKKVIQGYLSEAVRSPVNDIMMQSGKDSRSLVHGTTYSVTFPTAFKTNNVTVTLQYAGSIATVTTSLYTRVTAVSSTGFSYQYGAANGATDASGVINWIAVGN